MKKGLVYIFLTVFCSILFASESNAAKLSESKLKKKKEGVYFTGLPLVNFSSDDGLGYGLRAYCYYNGERDDKYFDTAPFFMQMYAQYFATTNGIQYHEFNVDMPYIFKTKFRIKTAFVYDKALNANFFGTGADASDTKLTNPVTGEEYDTFSDYEDGFLTSGDRTSYKYNKYTITKPTYYIYLYRNLTDWLKLLCGAEFKKAKIEPWDGRTYEYNDHKYDSGITLLDQLKPAGYDGGWTNFARFGITIDTRDYEPDPRRGIFIDYAYEIADNSLGSDYDFMRSTAGARFYLPIFSRLVLACQGAYTDVNGDVPFYSMNYFGFAISRRNGLGGNRTLRGFKKDRFVGRTMTMGNAELRLKFAETSFSGQRFVFKLIGFAESGNVYDEAGDPFNKPRWGEYKHSYGGGLVIAWNLATIIHAYYGVSNEDTGIFVNFEHNF